MLPRAKAGARPVILSAEAQKILRHELEGHASEWVFPGPTGRPYGLDYVSAEFRRAARGAGLKETSTSTTSATTVRRWPSTPASRPRSSWPWEAGKLRA